MGRAARVAPLCLLVCWSATVEFGVPYIGPGLLLQVWVGFYKFEKPGYHLVKIKVKSSRASGSRPDRPGQPEEATPHAPITTLTNRESIATYSLQRFGNSTLRPSRMSAYFMFAERSYRTTRRSRTGLCLKSEEKHLFTIR